MLLEMQLANSHKFTFPLKSRTEKKRLLEAKEKLLALYPFEVPEENIFVARTKEKGIFDIYISQDEFEKEKHLKRNIIVAGAAFLVLLTLVLCVRYAFKVQERALSAQKQLSLQEAEEKRILKQKMTKLENLKKEYSQVKLESYDRIYPYLERIYSVMGKNSTIENISIDRSSFSVEVSTLDAMKVLQNFEENESFSSVKMNRTTVNGSRETVTYSGLFARFWKELDESLPLDEKIAFYEEEISKAGERKKKQAESSLSEYIKSIREILHKDKGSEQYIQIRGSGDNAEIEFFILSSSRNILNFISDIQKQEDNLVDVKQLRIRNSEIADRVQTTISFDSGINVKQMDEPLSEYEEKKISADELNKIFYKKPVAKAVAKKAPVYYGRPKAAPAKKIVKSAQPLKKLDFIGFTKTGGKTLVMVKDNEMGSIYKLPVVEAEIPGDCCIENQGGYQAKIRGEYYEVKR